MSPEAGERAPADPAPVGRRGRPYAAIGLGFLALALPLFLAIPFSTNATGRWTNAAAGAVFVALGTLLWAKRS